MERESTGYGSYRNYYRADGAQHKQGSSPRHRVGALLMAMLAGFAGGVLSSFVPLGYGADRPASSSVVLRETATQEAVPSVAEAVAAIAGPSVVEVSTESKRTHPFFGSYVTGGAGSGVILSADGFLVTNQHVVSGCERVSIRLQNGDEYEAQVVGSDVQTDLAVLKIDAADLPAVSLADSDAIAVGQPAIAIGNPLGTLGGTVTEGIISATDREILVGNDTMALLQTSAAINPGNSGGGLFDRNGHLIGVVNAKSAGSNIEGLGFAIPANTVREVAAELIANGYVSGRPALGVTVVEISNAEALQRAKVSAFGVYVTWADTGTGLQNGDRLLEVNGEKIANTASLRRALSGQKVGEPVEVVVHRNGESTRVTVVLREKAPD